MRRCARCRTEQNENQFMPGDEICRTCHHEAAMHEPFRRSTLCSKFKAPTRVCKKCGEEQGKDQFMPAGETCFTCHRTAAEKQLARKKTRKLVTMYLDEYVAYKQWKESRNGNTIP